MTDRREQWLRTLRHPYPFSARYPAPARRLQESRTWPRHGATARIASTVVNTAAVRRKEEKEEGELSSSDDDAVPSSLVRLSALVWDCCDQESWRLGEFELILEVRADVVHLS